VVHRVHAAEVAQQREAAVDCRVQQEPVRQVVEDVVEHQDRDDIQQCAPQRRRLQCHHEGCQHEKKGQVAPQAGTQGALDHRRILRLGQPDLVIGAIELPRALESRHLEDEEMPRLREHHHEHDQRDTGLPVVGGQPPVEAHRSILP